MTVNMSNTAILLELSITVT